MLAASSIRVAFGGVKALDGVTIEARAGEILGLIGPNGSGKSTLMDVLCGARVPDDGQIALSGRPLPVGRMAAMARLGIVRTFQVPRLAQRLTVVQNLLAAAPDQPGNDLAQLFFRPTRVREAEGRALVQAAGLLRRLGLGHMADAAAGTLSGGQQKLLSLGVAMMMSPSVLLLDEPAAGVNPTLVARQVQILRELCCEGRIVVLIEHNMEMIAAACDRVAVLDQGAVIVTGTPAAVRADARVRRSYLGEPV